MKASSHLPFAVLVAAIAAPIFARAEPPAAHTSPMHPIVVVATPGKIPSKPSLVAPLLDTPAYGMPYEANRLVPVLPGEIVGALPLEITRPLPQQVVRALPNQLVRPLPGQIVQPLPGQIVQPLPGQIVR